MTETQQEQFAIELTCLREDLQALPRAIAERYVKEEYLPRLEQALTCRHN